ncbi:hypothetical protein A0J61_09684 [Choanephora cucurbitarum]|uniref:Galactose oxidase n=1 Tax=Choanephora cucurbitarum TaxID=101091 RepID=A0A1C7N0T5_9FUNG|nr:hypothetical protein A0J61_09684 [Choanephora cucurbitarum]
MVKLVWSYSFLSTILQVLLVQGSIQSRKHATVHYIDGVLYILGGVTDPDTIDLSIGLYVNKTDLSFHSPFYFTDFKGYGHTSHFDHTSNTILTVSGQLPNKTTQPLLYIPLNNTETSKYQHHQVGILPHDRLYHTSILLNQTELYVIGGMSSEANHLLWRYNLSKQAWKAIETTNHLASISGHISFTYRYWIISCFGLQNNQLSNHCLWMNTIDSSVHFIQGQKEAWPVARQFTTISALEYNRYVLFGGQIENQTVLDDVWQLEIDDVFQMIWTPLNQLSGIHKRSGHTNTVISDLILYYGGQDQPSSSDTEVIYLDKTKLVWVQMPSLPVYRFASVVAGHEAYGEQLSQASIVGIIIAALIIAAGLTVFIIWYFKKKYRHKEPIKSRISQFRKSHKNWPMAEKHGRKRVSAPRLDVIEEGESTEELEGNEDQLMELPQVVLHDHHKSRISALSLGTEFQFSPSEFFHSNARLLPSAESPVPQKTGPSPRIKQLTLSLLSSNYHPGSNKHIGVRPKTPTTPSTPQTPMSRFLGRHQTSSRGSVGSQSVSSVQWIGFNDGMDYKESEQDLYNSSSHSVQLAVTNGSAPQTTPNTPTFPAQVK